MRHYILQILQDAPSFKPERAQQFLEATHQYQEQAAAYSEIETVDLTPRDYKSIRILIPIQERGNSSSQLRMIHRQWYHRIQRVLDEENKIQNYIIQDNIRKAVDINVKIELRFVLVDPAARSKASTQDKTLGDLYGSTQRAFKVLPGDLFENFQCCTDVLIMLHSSFILVTVEGFHQLRKVLTGESEAVCFNLSEERCFGDSVAFGKELQLLHSNGEVDLKSSLHTLHETLTTSMMNSDASITQASIAGLKNTFMAKIEDQNDDNGFIIPAQYYGEGPNTFSVDLLLSPTNPCTGRATHLFFIESRASRPEIRTRVRQYLLSDGAQQAGTFEMFFLIGRSNSVSQETLRSEQVAHNDLIQLDLPENHESFTTQAHLAAIAFGAECENIESVTHLQDMYKLNIRRLYKEVLTPGISNDSFICLDALLKGTIKIRSIARKGIGAKVSNLFDRKPD